MYYDTDDERLPDYAISVIQEEKYVYEAVFHYN